MAFAIKLIREQGYRVAGAVELSWPRFCRQLSRDGKLWLVSIVLLTLYRILFLTVFSARMAADSGLPTILQSMEIGFRFDSKVATMAMAPSFFLTLISGFVDWEHRAERLRLIMGVMFWGCILVLGRIAIGYFKEYDDLFNQWLFGLYYDDPAAIGKTIYAQYHVILELLAGILLLSLGAGICRNLVARPLVPDRLLVSITGTVPRRVIFSLLIGFLIVGGVRGSFGGRPIQLKDSAVTRDGFLNKATINPFVALKYAVSEHFETVAGGDIHRFLPNNDIGRAVTRVTGVQENSDIDNALKRYASGFAKQAPRHIFLIVGESYDGWPLLEQFASLGVTNELKALAKDGLQVRPFMAAADGTMSSFDSILTGMPFSGVLANYQHSGLTAYPTSLPDTFRRLGYKTRFFYGGYLSWQNIGDFCKHQGFEEIYGGADMAQGGTRKEWGVDDEEIFKFAEQTVTDEGPSFNIILTTSNHSPYNVDTQAKGFKPPNLPPKLQKIFQGEENLKHLSHLWYADRCIGRFARGMEKRFPSLLVAVTGDHFGRWYPGGRPGLYEKVAVPFVLYGPQVLAGKRLPPNVAGSHKDIAATLIELAAPQGFMYYALGKNLLAPSSEFVAIEKGRAITAAYVADLDAMVTAPLPWLAPPLEQTLQKHNALLGVALWRVRWGADIRSSGAGP